MRDRNENEASAILGSTDCETQQSNYASPVATESATPVATDTASPVATDVASSVATDAPPLAATSGGAVLRSMTEAQKNRDMLMKGADMCCIPVDPYETEDSVINAVLAWAANPQTNGEHDNRTSTTTN